MQNRRQPCSGRDCSRRMGQYLDPALLLLLQQAPSHGYTLLSRLAEFGLDFLAPTVVYRALRDMETRGWVSSTWNQEETQGPPRRVYALTPVGGEVLRCCLAQLRETQQIIEYVLALHAEIVPEDEPTAAAQLAEAEPRYIVIPADGTDLDAPVSDVFGRCQTFIFVEPLTLDFEAFPNPAQDVPEGAGVQATQTVLQQGARAVVASSLGPNAFRVLTAAGVPAYRLQGQTVREVVDAFNAGTLPRLDRPGAPYVGLGQQ